MPRMRIKKAARVAVPTSFTREAMKKAKGTRAMPNNCQQDKSETRKEGRFGNRKGGESGTQRRRK